MNVLAISGSLRRNSLNSAALRACQALAPDGMVIEIWEGLRDIPPYDDDDFKANGFPPVIAALRDKIRAADAVIIATPEYNHSIPGVLKNAIDWVSRPPEVPFVRKSYAIFGASMGGMGTIRAQYHLRDMLLYFDAVVLNKPEVFIGAAHTKFSASGELTDQPTRDILGQMLAALQAQTKALAP